MSEYNTYPVMQLPEPDPVSSHVDDLVKLAEAHECTSSKAVKEILEMTMSMLLERIEAEIYPAVSPGQIVHLAKP